MARQALILLAVVLIFGVLVPWYKGVAILQPTVVVAYAMMALLFVAPAASEFWTAIPDPVSPGTVLGRVLAIVGYGWGLALLILITAFATLNLVSGTNSVLLPPRPFLAAVLLFSLTASLAVAVLCALLARRFSSAGAKGAVRILFLLLLLLLAAASRVLPGSWQIALADHSTRRALTQLAWEGSAICSVIAVAGLLWLVQGVRSHSLPAAG